MERCLVKLTAPRGQGTGFFVAPGLILTCAHVVKGVEKQLINVCWQNQENLAEVRVERTLPDCDIALLRFNPPPESNYPCVYLDKAVESRDELYLFGYPDRDYPDGCPVTVDCEGFAGDQPRLLKFKMGQIRPGMSGSPLLNKRTRKVCGIVKFNRDRSSDLGGGGIPVSAFLSKFDDIIELQRQFHQKDQRWKENLFQSNIPIDTFHEICKKIIKEQLRAVGHDKYIPDIYVSRKAEQEIETFVQFEKTFFKRTTEILDKLAKISRTAYLGEISSSYFSSAKSKIRDFQKEEQYFSFIA